MQHDFIIVAAGIGDILSALVPVVVFIIWVIGQIANRNNAAPAKPVRRAEPRPAANWDADDDIVVAQPANAGPAGAKPTVFDEIEQFLARARQQAQQAQQGRPAQAPAPVARPIIAEPVVAEVVAPRRSLAGEPASGSRYLGTQERIVANVARTVDTSDITAGIDKLGDSVEIADDVMEAHLKQVFDHRLGSLQQAEPVQAAASAAGPQREARKAIPAPVGFAAMLANSGNLRQAIVMNEILTRPADRW